MRLRTVPWPSVADPSGDRRRGPGRGVRRGHGLEGDGRRHVECHHLLGDGEERRLRPEQGHRRADGPGQRHHDHAIHANAHVRPAGEPTALVSRATGPTQPPTIPGVPAQAAGVFNQNITGAQAGSNWAQALNVWTTPWGFLKAAAGHQATVRRQGGLQVVSFSPANLKSPSGRPTP